MIKVLEYDKNIFTVKEFEDLIQGEINNSNDLKSIQFYDCHATNSIFAIMLFGDKKEKITEIISFGPDRMNEVTKAINNTIQFAKTEQSKEVLNSDVKILNKATRVVGFLILQKLKEPANAKGYEEKENRQDKEVADESIREAEQKELPKNKRSNGKRTKKTD